jgi:hypothetical protein
MASASTAGLIAPRGSHVFSSQFSVRNQPHNSERGTASRRAFCFI